MVSKASDDLPDPLTPVMTISERCGSVTSTFLRLWVRAPRTTIWPLVSSAMYVENSGGTGTVHRSAAVETVQPRRANRVILSGRYVSPSVHRQPALYGDGSRVAGAPVQRRRTHVCRPSRRSGDRPPARLRVRGLRGSRGRGRGDQEVRPGAVQGTRPGGQRGAAPRRRGRRRPPRPGGFSGPRPGGYAVHSRARPAARAATRRVPAVRRRPAARRRRRRRGAAGQQELRPRRAAQAQAQTARQGTRASPRARSSSGRSPASTRRTRIGARSTRRRTSSDIDNIATHKDRRTTSTSTSTRRRRKGRTRSASRSGRAAPRSPCPAASPSGRSSRRSAASLPRRPGADASPSARRCDP